jgi:hypothetical protein
MKRYLRSKIEACLYDLAWDGKLKIESWNSNADNLLNDAVCMWWGCGGGLGWMGLAPPPTPPPPYNSLDCPTNLNLNPPQLPWLLLTDWSEGGGGAGGGSGPRGTHCDRGGGGRDDKASAGTGMPNNVWGGNIAVPMNAMIPISVPPLPPSRLSLTHYDIYVYSKCRIKSK